MFVSGENFGKTPLSQEPYLFLYSNYLVKNYFNPFLSLLLFLSYPLVSGILIFTVISLFYLQIRLSKFSIYSILLIFVSTLTALSAYGLRSASWIECSFLFIGLVIVVLDHLFLGGTNIFGSFGIALLIVSLFMVMIPGFEKVGLLDLDSLVFSLKSIQNRLYALASGLFLSLIFISFYKRAQVRKKGLSNIENKDSQDNTSEKGYQFTSSNSSPTWKGLNKRSDL
jgi:membrane-bound ClpP family serine protease